ncbi:uncharacterized protein LOC134530739 [Bacillus rossius redtenbacheri]|uniref:uncharacterized protein LOC134530739 n=1 Tax=Bacillus rossius redtenbacheri TaxID=93214 RepID=UPI002FDF0415
MWSTVFVNIIFAIAATAHGIEKRSTNSELYGGQFDGDGYVRDLSEQVMSKFYLALPTFYSCNMTFQDQRGLSGMYMKITEGKLQDDISLKIRNYSYGLEPLTSVDDWFLVNVEFLADTYTVALNYTVSPLSSASPESAAARVDVNAYSARVTLFFMGEGAARQASSPAPLGESSYTVSPLTSSAGKKIYGEAAVRLAWEYYYFNNVRDKILDLTYSTSRQMDIFKYFS